METKEKEKYLAEEFVKVPIYRGYDEIADLYDICRNKGALILGGYARWMCSPRQIPAKVSDVDVYCPDEKIFEEMKTRLKKEGLKVKNSNDIAIGYLRPEHPHRLFVSPPIQLIKPMREGVIVTDGDFETILKNFDFTVIRIGIEGHSALADPDFIEDERNLRLRVKNIHCPISSMYRVMKYRAKGYWPTTGLLLKLFLDWEERPPETKKKIVTFYKKLESKDNKITEKEIDEMERLMRLID